MSVLYIDIDANSHGQRLDNYLAKHFKVPRALLYRLLRTGQILLNDHQKVTFFHKLQAGDRITLHRPIRHRIPDAHQTAASERICQHLPILHEDQDLLIVNKPTGLASHGGSNISIGLIESLRRQYPRQYFELVHRLDKDTSGLMLVAKKRNALLALQKQFTEKRIKKIYLALTEGCPPHKQQLIEAPLFTRHREGETRTVSVDPIRGKPAKTFVQQITCQHQHALIRAHPYTGRTHQIRVHLAHIGCPIIGDQRYGKQQTNDNHSPQRLRLFLHAYHLSFTHPSTHEPYRITAPIPLVFVEHALHLKIAATPTFFEKNALVTERTS